MKRILATADTVAELFEPASMPYTYTDSGGNYATCEMPALRCKACGWTSLYGIGNLPFPHECHSTDVHAEAPATYNGVAGSVQTF